MHFQLNKGKNFKQTSITDILLVSLRLEQKMLHSTAVFPPIYNGLVCWEIWNIILLFKSMFEEIWNRKINKSYVWNESHCECSYFANDAWDSARVMSWKCLACVVHISPNTKLLHQEPTFFFCCWLSMVRSSDFYAESWREKSMLVTVTVSTFSTFSLFQANLHLPLGSPSILWCLSQRCYQQQ